MATHDRIDHLAGMRSLDHYGIIDMYVMARNTLSKDLWISLGQSLVHEMIKFKRTGAHLDGDRSGHSEAYRVRDHYHYHAKVKRLVFIW